MLLLFLLPFLGSICCLLFLLPTWQFIFPEPIKVGRIHDTGVNFEWICTPFMNSWSRRKCTVIQDKKCKGKILVNHQLIKLVLFRTFETRKLWKHQYQENKKKKSSRKGIPHSTPTSLYPECGWIFLNPHVCKCGKVLYKVVNLLRHTHTNSRKTPVNLALDIL